MLKGGVRDVYKCKCKQLIISALNELPSSLGKERIQQNRTVTPGDKNLPIDRTGQCKPTDSLFIFLAGGIVRKDRESGDSLRSHSNSAIC